MYVLKNKSVEKLERRIEHLEICLITQVDPDIREDMWDQIEDINAELARWKRAAESSQNTKTDLASDINITVK
jgi:uncharacterized coiled-coil DUF342 family protein